MKVSVRNIVNFQIIDYAENALIEVSENNAKICDHDKDISLFNLVR